MNRITLAGCRPTPLAHYLKALAVLRLVSEQLDSNVRGAWENDEFVLYSSVDRDELVSFFLDRYAPTPIVSPWNGGSGFAPKDNQAALSAIESSETSRLKTYRESIAAARCVLSDLGLEAKPETSEKLELVHTLRGRLPDAGLQWLDAAVAIKADGVEFPPLLGTGGNDGRLDFSQNFMQRLLDVMDAEGKASALSEEWLKIALFGDVGSGLTKNSIGQFMPNAVGGANASSAIDSVALVNPWDFVLMIEGSLLFQAAMMRRFGAHTGGTHVAPFTFRPLSAGAGSLVDAGVETGRSELWMPLWAKPAGANEISQLLTEGRVGIGGENARDALDVIRAIGSLGVDRGITEFQRFGLLERNGLSYLATPLNRLKVSRRPEADLLTDIDRWLGQLRRSVSGELVPNSVVRVTRRLEEAIWTMCEFGRPNDVLRTMTALAATEAGLARSLAWATDDKVRISPVPPLSTRWLSSLPLDSAEARLAFTLASYGGKLRCGATVRNVSIREHVAPIEITSRAQWLEHGSRDTVWAHGELAASFIATMLRRLPQLPAPAVYSDASRVSAQLTDIAAFIHGPFDDVRFESLFRAFLLVDWRSDDLPRLPRAEGAEPDGLYRMLKLCFTSHPLGEAVVPPVAEILRRAAAGDGRRASLAASRRLTGSVGRPAIREIAVFGPHARRTAAALIFPISHFDTQAVFRSVFLPEE